MVGEEGGLSDIVADAYICPQCDIVHKGERELLLRRMKRRRVIVASVMIILIAISIARPIVHESSLTSAQRDMINLAEIRSDWEG